MHYQNILVVAAALIFSGCNSQLTRDDTAAEQGVKVGVPPASSVTPSGLTASTSPSDTEAYPPLPADIWSELSSGYALQDIQHPRIERETQRLLSHLPAFDRLLVRTTPFLFYILNEVQARGMPTEIALLPAVESGFQPLARSRNGAAGLWQFMPRTGEVYDLRQDWWTDHRRDAIDSTTAALDHLEYLHRRFDGDWLLALAAYNAGEGKVGRAVKQNRAKNQPADFFSLDLPRETDNYIPRLLALSRVIGNPVQYGVNLPSIDNSEHFAIVDTGGQIDLHVAAELASISPEVLLTLNAGCNRAATHPDGPHRLMLPIGVVQTFEQNLKNLPDDQRLRQTRHKIRSGETLSHIARAYGVSVPAIKQTNNLRNNNIRAGKHLMIPLSGSATLISSRGLVADKPINYRVRKGDSLYRIANRFEVKISDLRSWNQLTGKYIKPGQKLVVHAKNDH